MFKYEIAIVLACMLFQGSSAFAEFSSSKRSINGTGETLGKGEFELGLSSLSYGIDDSWLVTTPSMMAILGYGRAELRHKFSWDEHRSSPYVSIETPRHYSLGNDYGIDFGEDRSHSLTIGGRMQFTPRMQGTSKGPRSRLHTQFLPNIEYDYYVNGNLLYMGIAEYRVYFGFTWALQTWHLGLIAGPATGFIPLPYAYLRF